MKFWVKASAGLALAGALAACGAVPPMDPEERLKWAVNNFNENWDSSDLAKQLPGATMAARVDTDEKGNTLVLMVNNVPTGNRTFDPNSVRKAMRPTLCEDKDFRELIESGTKVRFEMTSNFGKELPAIQFARCG